MRLGNPPAQWIKINTDGARCFGFAKAIGACSTLKAELWGIYEGVATVWSLRFPQVIVETDSTEAYKALVHNNHKCICSSVLPYIGDIVSRNWRVGFSFVQREGNAAANSMVRLAWDGPIEYKRFIEPPPGILDLLEQDAMKLVASAAI
ncbi:hypothetical protein GQ457_08G015450 [Hibiscus cannabinus]